MATIELRRAVLCVVCETVSDSRESRGDMCIVCGQRGGLLSLARVLGEGEPEARVAAC